MDSNRLAIPDPANYRFAVFCCSFKMDLSYTPDHALALFSDEAMAYRKRYSAKPAKKKRS